MAPNPKENAMTVLTVSPLLRFALTLDAAATAATGAALLPFAQELAPVLGLPTTLLSGAAVFMLAYAAVVAWLRGRATLPRWAVWTVIVGNALWALDCALLAFAGVLAPSTLGVAFLLTQAVIVAGFAELQYFGLRRSANAA
jgi:hypothetical protein